MRIDYEGDAVLKWFKRAGRGSRARSRSGRLPKRHLAPVEEIVEQGVLVAEVAIRMTVKNEIIMNALGKHLNYDVEQIRSMVKNATLAVADERQRDADHIQKMRNEIRRTGESAWSDTQYSGGDKSTLSHRQQVYEGVAEHLRDAAENEEFVNSTAEKARTLAWSEIGDSLKDRAEHPYYSGGNTEQYRQMREARIETLIEEDLAELKREAKKLRRDRA